MHMRTIVLHATTGPLAAFPDFLPGVISLYMHTRGNNLKGAEIGQKEFKELVVEEFGPNALEKEMPNQA